MEVLGKDSATKHVVLKDREKKWFFPLDVTLVRGRQQMLGPKTHSRFSHENVIVGEPFLKTAEVN